MSGFWLLIFYSIHYFCEKIFKKKKKNNFYKGAGVQLVMARACLREWAWKKGLKLDRFVL
jgi:hypothetical protein